MLYMDIVAGNSWK